MDDDRHPKYTCRAGNRTGSPRGVNMNQLKQQVVELLKSFETGDAGALSSINPDKYVQHNLSVEDGLSGLKARLKSRPTGSTLVKTIRVYQDGDFVFAHTQYNFSGRKMIGFDIFRFESGKIVEHWDNLQDESSALSPSGHSMVDGPVDATDLDKTEANKALMKAYMDDLLVGRKETFPSYFNGIAYIQHNPWVGDNLTGLVAGLTNLAKEGKTVKYNSVKRILGEGNFVLVVADGSFGDQMTAYYDFYRIDNGKLAEHWDTLQAIPPESEWKNRNGKY
jgi:predicted SnoaL-like aldol condensation-catalyzing enzyme